MSAKKVAIVGTRTYPHLDRVRSYIATLPPDTIVVSGGALGVDSTADEAARRLCTFTVVYARLDIRPQQIMHIVAFGLPWRKA